MAEQPPQQQVGEKKQRPASMYEKASPTGEVSRMGSVPTLAPMLLSEEDATGRGPVLRPAAWVIADARSGSLEMQPARNNLARTYTLLGVAERLQRVVSAEVGKIRTLKDDVVSGSRLKAVAKMRVWYMRHMFHRLLRSHVDQFRPELDIMREVCGDFDARAIERETGGPTLHIMQDLSSSGSASTSAPAAPPAASAGGVHAPDARESGDGKITYNVEEAAGAIISSRMCARASAEEVAAAGGASAKEVAAAGGASAEEVAAAGGASAEEAAAAGGASAEEAAAAGGASAEEAAAAGGASAEEAAAAGGASAEEAAAAGGASAEEAAAAGGASAEEAAAAGGASAEEAAAAGGASAEEAAAAGGASAEEAAAAGGASAEEAAAAGGASAEEAAAAGGASAEEAAAAGGASAEEAAAAGGASAATSSHAARVREEATRPEWSPGRLKKKKAEGASSSSSGKSYDSLMSSASALQEPRPSTPGAIVVDTLLASLQESEASAASDAMDMLQRVFTQMSNELRLHVAVADRILRHDQQRILVVPGDDREVEEQEESPPTPRRQLELDLWLMHAQMCTTQGCLSWSVAKLQHILDKLPPTPNAVRLPPTPPRPPKTPSPPPSPPRSPPSEDAGGHPSRFSQIFKKPFSRSN